MVAGKMLPLPLPWLLPSIGGRSSRHARVAETPRTASLLINSAMSVTFTRCTVVAMW